MLKKTKKHQDQLIEKIKTLNETSVENFDIPDTISKEVLGDSKLFNFLVYEQMYQEEKKMKNQDSIPKSTNFDLTDKKNIDSSNRNFS